MNAAQKRKREKMGRYDPEAHGETSRRDICTSESDVWKDDRRGADERQRRVGLFAQRGERLLQW